MKKVFVLDTNVILSDSEAIFKFQEHTVVIPMPVIQEIDKFKKEQNELGRNARAFSRHMDKLRKQGSLVWYEAIGKFNGTPIVVNEEGGTLKVVLYHDCYGATMCGADMSKPDNQILACAMSLQKESTDLVILVTKDINLRLAGDIYGVEAQDYENDKVAVDDQYTGLDRSWVTNSVIEEVYAKGKVSIDCLGPFDELDDPNIGITLVNELNEKNTALTVYDDVMKELVLLPEDQTIYEITPRNSEQKYALNLLMNPEIELVTMTGKAGCGKTLMALLGGLFGVESQQYDRMVLLKPIVAMDNSHELGFLPGDMDEKLKPWMASFADNLQVIMGNMSKEDLKITAKKAGKKQKKLTKAEKAEQAEQDAMEEKMGAKIPVMDELKALGLVECGSLEHMRGRSMPRQYIIIDEAQNLTPHAAKTIVTRAGVGTKIILMGDIGQIDNPYVDATNNGLVHVINRMKHFQITGHISMKKSERSRLAELASDVL